MKKLIPLFSAALFMVACNSAPEQVASSASPFLQQQVQQPAVDTAGLAAFNAWKSKNELSDARDYMAQDEAVAPVKKATVAKKKSAPARVKAVGRQFLAVSRLVLVGVGSSFLSSLQPIMVRPTAAVRKKRETFFII